MRFPFQAILIGLVVGAALFFLPFGLPFFFFFFFIFLLSRFFFGWGQWRYYQRNRYYDHNHYPYDITPIDGYKTYQRTTDGKETKISID